MHSLHSLQRPGFQPDWYDTIHYSAAHYLLDIRTRDGAPYGARFACVPHHIATPNEPLYLGISPNIRYNQKLGKCIACQRHPQVPRL